MLARLSIIVFLQGVKLTCWPPASRKSLLTMTMTMITRPVNLPCVGHGLFLVGERKLAACRNTYSACYSSDHVPLRMKWACIREEKNDMFHPEVAGEKEQCIVVIRAALVLFVDFLRVFVCSWCWAAWVLLFALLLIKSLFMESHCKPSCAVVSQVVSLVKSMLSEVVFPSLGWPSLFPVSFLLGWHRWIQLEIRSVQRSSWCSAIILSCFQNILLSEGETLLAVFCCSVCCGCFGFFGISTVDQVEEKELCIIVFFFVVVVRAVFVLILDFSRVGCVFVCCRLGCRSRGDGVVGRVRVNSALSMDALRSDDPRRDAIHCQHVVSFVCCSYCVVNP